MNFKADFQTIFRESNDKNTVILVLDNKKIFFYEKKFIDGNICSFNRIGKKKNGIDFYDFISNTKRCLYKNNLYFLTKNNDIFNNVLTDIKQKCIDIY